MSKNILPLEKELPIQYMHTVVCLNDIYERLFSFKKGVVYEFFRKGDNYIHPGENKYYVKAYGTDMYQEIDFRLVRFPILQMSVIQKMNWTCIADLFYPPIRHVLTLKFLDILVKVSRLRGTKNF